MYSTHKFTHTFLTIRAWQHQHSLQGCGGYRSESVSISGGWVWADKQCSAKFLPAFPSATTYMTVVVICQIVKLTPCVIRLHILNKYPTLTINNLSFIGTNIQKFMAFYRIHFQEATVLPKMHMLDHFVPFLRKWHTGSGFFGEQGAESIHAAINWITPSFLNMADRVERLKGVMREHERQIVPCLLIVNLKMKAQFDLSYQLLNSLP